MTTGLVPLTALLFSKVAADVRQRPSPGQYRFPTLGRAPAVGSPQRRSTNGVGRGGGFRRSGRWWRAGQTTPAGDRQRPTGCARRANPHPTSTDAAPATAITTASGSASWLPPTPTS